MNIKLSLVVLGIDLSNGQYYVMSINNELIELPFIEINETSDIEQLIRELKVHHVELDCDWIYHKLYQYEKNSDTLTLFYKATIPLDSTLVNAYWLPINMQQSQKIILEALRD